MRRDSRQRERARLIGEMAQQARALYSDSGHRDENGEIAGEGLEDWLESIEQEERDAGVDPDERWWT